jgi:hypothetical protein
MLFLFLEFYLKLFLEMFFIEVPEQINDKKLDFEKKFKIFVILPIFKK